MDGGGAEGSLGSHAKAVLIFFNISFTLSLRDDPEQISKNRQLQTISLMLGFHNWARTPFLS